MRKLPTPLVVAACGWGGRAIAILCQIANIRFLSASLGTDQFALYSVLAGLAGWFSLADLGLPPALQNAISYRRAKDQSADDLIAAAAAMALVLIPAAILFWWVAGGWLAVYFVGQCGENRCAESFPVFAIAGSVAGISAIIYRVWFAEHRGYLAHAATAAASIAGTLGAWALTRWGGGAPVWLMGLVVMGPLAIIPTALLLQRMKNLPPRPFTTFAGLGLIRRALPFWWLEISAMAVLNVDLIILSWTRPAVEIVLYAVVSRIYQTVFMLFQDLLLALWPGLAEALANRRGGYVAAALTRGLLAGGVLLCVATLSIWLVGDQLIAILVPDQPLTLTPPLILAFGIYMCVRFWCDLWATALLAMSRMRTLLFYVPVQAALSIVLQYYGATKFGLEGLLAGLSGSFLLTAVWVLPYDYFKAARTAEPITSIDNRPA